MRKILGLTLSLLFVAISARADEAETSPAAGGAPDAEPAAVAWVAYVEGAVERLVVGAPSEPLETADEFASDDKIERGEGASLTRLLMEKFDERWSSKGDKAGQPAAEALRQTQAHVLSTDGFEHPYYWAAWVS